ncbi:MAG: TetR/AcrR family transcriptional regulator [Pseudomonadota bacterium]
MSAATKKARSSRSLTTKGQATRAAILDTAHEVFQEMGYYGLSISEITRRCRVSQGSFYQYFRNKEEVFLELNDLTISRFMKRVASLSEVELPLEDRLRESLRILYEHTRENFAFHRILGESELIDRVTNAYYESIAQFYQNFFRRLTQDGTIRPLDPHMLAYGLIGMCYFHSLEWEPSEEKYPQEKLIELLLDLVQNGISGPAPWKKPSSWDLLSLPDPIPIQNDAEHLMTKGEKTRKAIVRAAEKVFGQHGFNRANIAEITREAGVAQGTFYVHFKSKSDLMEGLIRELSHKIRRELQRFVLKISDRRDVERVGTLAFLQFIRQHREIYHVIPEVEMVNPEASFWYYNRWSQGYIQGLKKGIQKGEIRNLPESFLARSLMGFVHIIGLKWIIWNPNPQTGLSSQLLKDIIEFILYGLSSKNK